MYADEDIPRGTDMRATMLYVSRVSLEICETPRPMVQQRGEFVGNVYPPDVPDKIPRGGNRFITFRDARLASSQTNATDPARLPLLERPN